MKLYKIRLSLLFLLLTLTHSEALKKLAATRALSTGGHRVENDWGRNALKGLTVLSGVGIGLAVATAAGASLPLMCATGICVAVANKVAWNGLDGKDTTVGDIGTSAVIGGISAVIAHGLAEPVAHACVGADHLGQHLTHAQQLAHAGLDTGIEQATELATHHHASTHLRKKYIVE